MHYFLLMQIKGSAADEDLNTKKFAKINRNITIL